MYTQYQIRSDGTIKGRSSATSKSELAKMELGCSCEDWILHIEKGKAVTDRYKKVKMIDGKPDIDNTEHVVWEDDEEAIIEEEIRQAKEKTLLEGALEHLSVKAKEKAEARLNKVKDKSSKN